MSRTQRFVARESKSADSSAWQPIDKESHSIRSLGGGTEIVRRLATA